jgi:hypothetical protein
MLESSASEVEPKVITLEIRQSVWRTQAMLGSILPDIRYDHCMAQDHTYESADVLLVTSYTNDVPQ